MPTPFEKEEYRIANAWRRKAGAGQLAPVPCLAVWMDICGFGAQLESSSWNLRELQRTGIVELLSEVYQRVGKPFWIGIGAEPSESILVINDGIARTVDLVCPEYGHAVHAIFYVRDLILAQLSLLRLTNQRGLGIRTILAGGERIQYAPEIFTGNLILQHNEIPSERGQKLLDKNFLYNPAEFQMNTAFAKAYSIDAAGTKSGFHVNGLFIEKTFFDRLALISDVGIYISDKSINVQHRENTALELIIENQVHFQFKGLATIVYGIKSVRIDESFEGEETIIDLVDFEIA